MNRPTRMSDVAKLAGVATMTVSRVLNGKMQVSKNTRARVLEAIRKLNYVPNEVARSLRDHRTRQIGIIVPNLHDPFFAQCAHSISLVAKERSYSTVITTSEEDPATEFIEAKRMLRRHIEGLIVVPAPGRSQLRDPEFEQTPIVTLDRPMRVGSFDSVVVENQRGAQLGVQHLIEHHHKRIICLGLEGRVWTKNQRLDGYLAAMKAARLESEFYAVSELQADMLLTVRELLSRKNPPTALFCTNNLIMRNTLHALTKLNVKIPEQIAIVGFDDFEMADLLTPPMTIVRQPTDDLGRIAAELLFSRLSDTAQIKRAKRIVLPVELVIRKSCGSHPREPRRKL